MLRPLAGNAVVEVVHTLLDHARGPPVAFVPIRVGLGSALIRHRRPSFVAGPDAWVSLRGCDRMKRHCRAANRRCSDSMRCLNHSNGTRGMT